MSIDHGKVLALADAPPIPAWLIDADQSRVWAAAWETLYRAIGLAQPAEAVEGADDYVAFLRFDDHNGTRPTSVHLCDSDHPDAFKVYREPKRITPTDAAQGAVAWLIESFSVFDGMRGHRFITQDAELASSGSHRAVTPLYPHPQAAPAQGDGCWPATKEEMEAYWEAYSAHRVHGEGEAIRAGLAAYQALRAAAPSPEPRS